MDSATIPRWSMGDRLAKARKSRGISQDEMAARLGVSRRTIVRYEGDDPLGKIRRGLVAQWATITSTPLWWILDKDPGNTEPDSNDRRDTSTVTDLPTTRKPTQEPPLAGTWPPLKLAS